MKISLAAIFATVMMLTSLAQATDSAAGAGKKDEGFQKHKQETLDHLDHMIASMQKMKSCASAAKSHEDMKACHESQKGEMHAMEEKNREHHKEMIDQRIKELQDEKAKLNQAPAPAGK